MCSRSNHLSSNYERNIIFGVNVNFGNFVYSPQETLRIAREELGFCHAEMVSDIATNVPLFISDRQEFEKFHLQIGEYAHKIGIKIATTFNFYRDNYSLTHSSAQFREVGLNTLKAILLQAECYRKAGHPTKYAGASFGSLYKEDYLNKELRKQLLRYGMDAWKELMQEGARIGLSGLTVEHMSTLREPPATIEQAVEMLGEFNQYHRLNPDSTVPVFLIYDTGHGVSETEGSQSDRRFSDWFKTFPADIVEIHLKNTDQDFQSTWPFTKKYRKEGIIDEFALIEAARDYLQGPELYLILEMGGKKGREIGEKATLTNILESAENVRKALDKAGYRQSKEGIWSLQ